VQLGVLHNEEPCGSYNALSIAKEVRPKQAMPTELYWGNFLE